MLLSYNRPISVFRFLKKSIKWFVNLVHLIIFASQRMLATSCISSIEMLHQDAINDIRKSSITSYYRLKRFSDYIGQLFVSACLYTVSDWICNDAISEVCECRNNVYFPAFRDWHLAYTWEVKHVMEIESCPWSRKWSILVAASVSFVQMVRRCTVHSTYLFDVLLTYCIVQLQACSYVYLIQWWKIFCAEESTWWSNLDVIHLLRWTWK